MSQSPAYPPANLTPPPTANGPVLKLRRPKPADPLVRPKKRPPSKPANIGQSQVRPSNGAAPANPSPAPVRTASKPPQATARAPVQPLKTRVPSADDQTVNGFSGPLLAEHYVDYPLVTTKRALTEGMRLHVARLASKKNIDIRDEEQFTRPVRLQRRDPRASVTTPTLSKTENGTSVLSPGDAATAAGLASEAAREEIEVKKAARAKEREENLAQIAPKTSSSGAKQKVSQPKKLMTRQVWKGELTPEEIAKQRIKYEEALPWHLEDFDNKNIWVGNYEAAMSETYAMFVLQDDGKIRMVPIDKWYKFNAKNQFRPLSIEEAEKHMARKVKDPRWITEKEQAQAQKNALERYARHNKVYTGKKVTTGNPSGFDGDDLDFEEDRFADDEEHMGVVEDDEDAKVTENRIRQDQLKANIFDLKDESMYDNEEEREKREKEALKNFGKSVRKALQRREKNFDYSSGSEADPYSEDESSEESEKEGLKAQEANAEEGGKRKEKSKEIDAKSGASSKGTNTPSGRPKHTDVLAASGRKRRGSPGISDASGTDTSRKKPKNRHASPQAAPSRSRPTSPPPPLTRPQEVLRKPSALATGPGMPGAKKRNKSGASSAPGSDVERGASGSETNEGVMPKKLKLNPPAPRSMNTTPFGSRAASPAPLGHAKSASARSRASSPDAAREATQPQPPPPRTANPVGGQQAQAVNPSQFPTPAEVHAAIPSSGIGIRDLIKVFQPRIGKERQNHLRFIALVKTVSVYTEDDKLLRPGTLKES